MRYTLAVAMAVTSLAFLFAIFRSSDGIKCYTCISMDSDNTRCEHIRLRDTMYVLNYNDSANNCMKMVSYLTKNGSSHRLLNRYGFPDEELEEINLKIRDLIRIGYKIEFRSCKTDLCNNF